MSRAPGTNRSALHSGGPVRKSYGIRAGPWRRCALSSDLHVALPHIRSCVLAQHPPATTLGAAGPTAEPAANSEQLQVPVELPLGDLLVGGLPLAALHLREVVDVVAVAGLAERG